MAALSKIARDTSRSPLSTAPQGAQNVDLTPLAGTKRLFSNRSLPPVDPTQGNNENEELEAASGQIHSDKRPRTDDWPLASTTDTNPANAPSARATFEAQDDPKLVTDAGSAHTPAGATVEAEYDTKLVTDTGSANAPAAGATPEAQDEPKAIPRPARRSKFIEGSMNDKVSQRPPAEFLGPEEDLLKKYSREESGGRKTSQGKNTKHRRNSSAQTSRSEDTRQSGIVRFGKSVAATLNISNWKIWSKQQHQQQDDETPQQKILRERQEKAEKIYKELKKSGDFRNSAAFPSHQVPEVKDTTPAKHDSGVDFGPVPCFPAFGLTSKADKRKSKIIESTETQIPANTTDSSAGNSRPSSMGSESAEQSTISASRQSFHFKRPSLSSIRKSKESDRASVAPSNDEGHPLHKVASRREMRKQQKLVKRVSNLEDKLAAARRQLAKATGGPYPPEPEVEASTTTTSASAPGAPTTLPSEPALRSRASSNVGSTSNDIAAVPSEPQNLVSQVGKFRRVPGAPMTLPSEPVPSGRASSDSGSSFNIAAVPSEPQAQPSQVRKLRRKTGTLTTLPAEPVFSGRVSSSSGSSFSYIAAAPSEPQTQLSTIRKPRFVPGALATLPSERLLSGYLSSDAEADLCSTPAHEIGRAVTTDENDNLTVKSQAKLQALPPQDILMQSVEIDHPAKFQARHSAPVRGMRTMRHVSNFSLSRLASVMPETGDSSDEDEEPVKKPAAKSPALETVYKGRRIIADSSNEYEEPVKKPVAQSSAPETASKKRKNKVRVMVDNDHKLGFESDSDSDSSKKLKLSSSPRPPRKVQKIALQPLLIPHAPRETSTRSRIPRVSSSPSPRSSKSPKSPKVAEEAGEKAAQKVDDDFVWPDYVF